MGRKKKQEIDLSQIKTVKFELNFSVPKEEFDEVILIFAAYHRIGGTLLMLI